MKGYWKTLAIVCLMMVVSLQHSKEEWKKRAIYQVLTDRFAKPSFQKGDCWNLQSYCGGTWKGITENLDYIQKLGFDAIWISPVIENIDGGYHGYWAKNIYKMNQNFGGEDELKELVDECHKRDIWVMVDVVGNHMGPVNTDYSQLYPFNRAEHYHDYCTINGDDFTHNQNRVENCRLAGLPDLKQENQYVQDELIKWIKWLVNEYQFDGIRIDTCPEVPKWFWSKFTQASGVFQICEVFDGRQDYVRDYQNHVDSLLNYPQYFTTRECFAHGQSLNNIQNLKQGIKQFRDESALGVFSDNHDNARFLHFNGDWEMLKNYISFNLGSEGVPIFYYGTEQGYAGDNDPNNREVLWNNLNMDHQLFRFTARINQVRKQTNYQSEREIQRYSSDNFYAFSRGKVLFLFTNVKYYIEYPITYHPFKNGDVLCSVFDSNRCVTVNNNQFKVHLNNGTPDILVQKGAVTPNYI